MARFKAYNWIPPVDLSINGKEYYRAKVLDATLDNKGHIVMKTDFYFPVGSIFHHIRGCVDYVIKSIDKHNPERIYLVCRCDGQTATLDDVYALKKNKWIFRTGFEHKAKD